MLAPPTFPQRGERMSDSFDFSRPDLFTAGTIGPPGQRVFYLQAREGETLVTLKCEKEQVRVLGEYLGRLLERLSPPPEAAAGDPALGEPATRGGIVGSMGVGEDEWGDGVGLVMEEVAEQEEEEDEAESEESGEGEPEAAVGPETEPEGEDESSPAEGSRASG